MRGPAAGSGALTAGPQEGGGVGWCSVDALGKQHLDSHAVCFGALREMGDAIVHHADHDIAAPQPGGGTLLINVTDRPGETARPPQDLTERVKKVVHGLLSFMDGHQGQLKRRLPADRDL